MRVDPANRRRPGSARRGGDRADLEGALLERPRTCRWCPGGPRGPRSGPRSHRAGSCHDRRSSTSISSMISASRARASWSSTGTTASTRRSRLRSIRSAEPMYQSAVAAVLEAPDPRVLQELADDRAHPDPLRDAGHAGLERAGAAHDEVDVHAGLRRAIERLDDRAVHDGVRLDHDPGRPAGRGVGDLAVDEFQEAAAHAVRRHEQPPEGALAGQAGQDVEQVRDVGADLRADGQQAEVHVQPGRLGVVVAGPDVDVAAQPGPLASDDERRLGVGLEARPARRRRARPRAPACAPR